MGTRGDAGGWGVLGRGEHSPALPHHTHAFQNHDITYDASEAAAVLATPPPVSKKRRLGLEEAEMSKKALKAAKRVEQEKLAQRAAMKAELAKELQAVFVQ